MGDGALAVGMPTKVAPKGWAWVPLTSIAQMESGHTPSRRKPEYWGGDIPWIGIKDAKRAHGGEITETLECTNALGIENSSARILPKGTVCLSRTASVGYVVRMGRNMATSQDFANWICSDRLDPEYLAYVFIAEGKGLLRFSSGSVHQTIYYPELKALHICIPPLEEQRRIVAILDEAFAGLARARARAEANLADAGELFGSYLARQVEHDASEFGVSTISEIAEEVTDGDHMPPPKSETGVPFITISNVNKETHEIDFSDTFMVPESYYSELKEKRQPRANDVLYSVTGSFGIPVLVTGEHTFCFQRHIALVRPKPNINSEWLYFMFLSPFLFDQADKGATGTAQRTVSLRLLRSLKIPNTPAAKQVELAAIGRKRWNATRALEDNFNAQLTDLDALRQSLLQRAFAGELT